MRLFCIVLQYLKLQLHCFSSLCRRTRQTVGEVTLSVRLSTLCCLFSCFCCIRLSAPTFTCYYNNFHLPLLILLLAPLSFSPVLKPSAPTSPLPRAPYAPPPSSDIVIGNNGTSHHSKSEALSATLSSLLQFVSLSDNCRTSVSSAG